MHPSVIRFIREMTQELRHVRWVLLGVAAYALLGVAYLLWRDAFTFATYGYYMDTLLLFMGVVVPLMSVVWLCFSSLLQAPRAPLAHMRAACTSTALARYVVGLLLLLLLIPFLGTYTQIKGTLSLEGFPFEQAMADADAWLFGGVDPAEWLATTLGGGALQRVLEVNYNVGWQVYHLLFITLVMLHPALRHVRRFYGAFYFAMWVLLGNLMAAVWMCAGPAFYAEVVGDPQRFAALEALLLAGKDHAHSAWRLQAYLWDHWMRGESALGTGVAAFPSVHVFVVVGNALLIHRYMHRALGWLAMGYAGIILISSAYLGWHYLIDGLVSGAIAVAAFTCCLRLYRPCSGS